jgi:hypothetical protein
VERTTQRGEYYAVNIMKKNKIGGSVSRYEEQERCI